MVPEGFTEVWVPSVVGDANEPDALDSCTVNTFPALNVTPEEVYETGAELQVPVQIGPPPY